MTTILELDNPVYHLRVKLRKYNTTPDIFGCVDAADAGHILLHHGGWTKDEHTELAEQHQSIAKQAQADYEKALNDAALATWGRPYQITDYKVSGIASEEFSDEWKGKLRLLCHGASAHQRIAEAHAWAAKRARSGVSA